MRTAPKLSISAAGVSETRVEQFLNDYLKGRESIGATEKIFRHFSAYGESEETNDKAAIGLNGLLRKGPLVDESDWAPMRGWEFAVAEERHLLGKLESAMADCAQSSNRVEPAEIAREPGAILQTAEHLTRRLSVDGYTPTLIVLAAKLDVDAIVEVEKRLDTPGWELSDELSTNWILGSHQGRIWLYLRDADIPRLYAVDVHAFGRLLQLAPPAELAVDDVPVDAPVKQGIFDAHDRVHLRLYQSYEFEARECDAVWAANIHPLESTDSPA
jgi:hypothetical protein